MKRSTLAIIVAVIYMPFFSNAQIFEIIKNRSLGTIGYENYPSLIAINDHELMMVCKTNCNIDGDKTDPICDDTLQVVKSDIWLVKMDTALNIIWNKSLGGAFSEYSPKIILDKTNMHIYISCTSISDSSCDKTSNSFGNITDIWIIELDTAGNIFNDHRYGGIKEEENPSLIILPNRDHLIWGATKSSIGGDKTSTNHSSQFDIWVIKTDSLGNMLWDRSYGGTGSENGLSGDKLNSPNSIYHDQNNNGFTIIGSTNSPQNGDISNPPITTMQSSPNLWVAKFDSSGIKIWDKRYLGIMDSYFPSTSLDSNMFLIVSSGISGYDMTDSNKIVGKPNIWIVKIDSTGNKIWDRFYGGSGGIVNGIGGTDRWPSQIEKSIDGGYLIAATTNNDIGYDISEPTYGGLDYWLFKIDENGNKLWDKRFGGSKNDICAGFLQMPDSSLYIYGYSDAGGVTSMKTDSGHFYHDIWIVHFKYHDTTTVTSVNSNFEFEQGIKLFPNPATNFCTVQSSKERINSVLVYNTVGELIDEIRSPSATSIQIPLASYAPGLYFATIKSEHHIVTKKLIIRN